MRIWSIPLSLLVVAACGSEDGMRCAPAQELSSSTPLPPEVDAIFERHCRDCHTEPLRMYAPMPLLDWEDVQMPRGGESGAEPIYALVGERIHSMRYPMPPVTRPPLDDEEKATLDVWIADCAPPALEE